MFDKSGEYAVNDQIFPTYYLYEDGKLVDGKLVNGAPQAPLENFIKLDAKSQVKASTIASH